MRSLHIIPLIFGLCINLGFSVDLPDESESKSLVNQMGYQLITVEGKTVNGLQTISIPLAAVFIAEGRTFVVAQNKKNPSIYNRWEVDLGKADGQYVDALAGVYPGDRIIRINQPLVAYQPSGSPQAIPQAPSAVPKRLDIYGVQIGAFSKEANARKIAENLKAKYGRTDVLHSESKGRSLYRVRVGEYENQKSAKTTKDELVAGGFSGAFVVAIK